MRTTITLAGDVAAAIQRYRRERSVGVSQAVNELIRHGLAVTPPDRPFEQSTVAMGAGIDVTNVAEAIDTLDGPGAR
jgi:hypothetical protein